MFSFFSAFALPRAGSLGPEPLEFSLLALGLERKELACFGHAQRSPAGEAIVDGLRLVQGADGDASVVGIFVVPWF